VELQEDTNDLVAAIDIYKQMIEKRTNSALLHYQLGLTYARKKQYIGNCRVRKGIAVRPTNDTRHYILALLYIDENRLPDAIKSLEQYLPKNQKTPRHGKF
jgi:tetratricopeptide (TPR) repeat protein